MKIMIIHSPPHGEVPFRSIGLIYIQTVLLEKGYDVEFLDISYIEDKNKKDYYERIIKYLSSNVGTIGDMPDMNTLIQVVYPKYIDKINELSKIVLEKVSKYFELIKDRADIFIFSNNVLTMYFSCALAKRLKDEGKITIGGGPTTHFIPFTHFTLLAKVFDYVVVGEGEELIIKLIRNIYNKNKNDLKVNGLYYIVNEDVFGFGKAYVKSINKPNFLCFKDIVINDFIPIIAGRGCPHRCRFCSEPAYWAKYRVRYVKDVINEMEYQSNLFKIINFHFHDDTINANLKWFDSFLNLLIKSKKKYQWESFCTPYGLNRERIIKMKESGCVLLKMGVQSFSDNVLKKMGRPTNVSSIIKTIKDCVKHGISMHFDLLTSFPGESKEDHKKNLRVLEELFDYSDKIYFSPNPFYLSIGSNTMLNPEYYGMKIKYYSYSSLPKYLRDILKKSGKFPESFRQSISDIEVKKRLEDYHKILIKYNKDYLFLGNN